MNAIVTAPTTIVITPFATESATPESAEHLRRAARVDRLLDLLVEVVLRLEEAEPPAAVRDVVDVVRELVDEVVHLVDEGRHERDADRRRRTRVSGST